MVRTSSTAKIPKGNTLHNFFGAQEGSAEGGGERDSETPKETVPMAKETAGGGGVKVTLNLPSMLDSDGATAVEVSGLGCRICGLGCTICRQRLWSYAVEVGGLICGICRQ